MAITDDIVARASADLQRALSSAEQSRAALAVAEAEVVELKGFLRRFERYAPMLALGGKPVSINEHVENNRRNELALGSRGRELVDTAIEAIKSAGRPMKIGELLDVVLEAGMKLGGSDQKSNLAGYLSRDPRVHSLGRSIGWDLVKDEKAASSLLCTEVASSHSEGGTDERSSLAGLDDIDALIG